MDVFWNLILYDKRAPGALLWTAAAAIGVTSSAVYLRTLWRIREREKRLCIIVAEYALLFQLADRLMKLHSTLVNNMKMKKQVFTSAAIYHLQLMSKDYKAFCEHIAAPITVTQIPNMHKYEFRYAAVRRGE